MTTSYDFGTYQASIIPPNLSPPGGYKLGGPIDLYSEKVKNREVHLLDFWPDPGLYTLRLRCTGKNPASQGHLLGIESVRLRERRPRVEKMGWDKDKDWRQELKLYG